MIVKAIRSLTARLHGQPDLPVSTTEDAKLPNATEAATPAAAIEGAVDEVSPELQSLAEIVALLSRDMEETLVLIRRLRCENTSAVTEKAA